MGSKNYKEADVQLSKYFGENFDTESFIELNEKTTPHVFKLSALDNANSSSDFGLSFYGDDKVAFASARNNENPTYRSPMHTGDKKYQEMPSER